MPVITFTAFFRDDDGHGWSEQHQKDGGVSITSLAAYLTAFNSLMLTARRPLLCGDSYYIGCRASYPTASKTIAGDNILNDPAARGPQTYLTNVLEMGAPSDAIKIRIRNEAATARSDIYLRGQPSDLVRAGVLDFSTIVGQEYKRRIDAYIAALIANQYGWIGVNPALTSRGDVTGYTQNLDETVTLNVTPTNGIVLPADGTKAQTKFARINSSNSVLNRLLVTTVQTGGAAVKTLEKIAVSDFETGGNYSFYTKGFIPYAAASYLKLAHRKTGRPFGVAPGRVRASVLH